jgi:4-amino-4-deoxy-L-arabinose transferase-like glycosyltransferase
MTPISPRRLTYEILLVGIILAFASFLRLYDLQNKPGYEWDEPIYANIIGNFATYGYPAIKSTGEISSVTPFLYHPPFDFALRSTLTRRDATIFDGRLVSVVASLLTLVVIYYFIRQMSGRKTALFALIVLSTDGWVVYINRLLLIENIFLLFVAISLAVYAFALKRRQPYLYAITGILFGLTAIYKHTGVYMLLIPFLFELLAHRNWRRAGLITLVAGGVMAIYVALMLATWGQTYIDQTVVQLTRALGLTEARGLNFSILDALKAIVDTYWIYFTTMVAILGGIVLVIWELVRLRRTREKPRYPLFLSWSIASLLFLGAIALRAPHYLPIVLLPLYVYQASYLVPLLARGGRHALASFLAIVVVLNGMTWYLRFIRHNDNTLFATKHFFATEVPPDAVVLTEQTIGVSITQPYYTFDDIRDEDALAGITPDYIVVYDSATQKLPDSGSLQTLLAHASIIAEFSGFKERIVVYTVEND